MLPINLFSPDETDELLLNGHNQRPQLSSKSAVPMTIYLQTKTHNKFKLTHQYLIILRAHTKGKKKHVGKTKPLANAIKINAGKPIICKVKDCLLNFGKQYSLRRRIK